MTIFVVNLLFYSIMSIGLSIKFEIHIHINKKDKDVDPGKESATITSTSQGDALQLAEQELKKWKGAVSPSTMDNYITALRSLKQYLHAEVGKYELNQETIKGYERWLRSRQLCLNTISCYMRSLRSLFNKIYNGNYKIDWFDSVFTGRTNTEKRSVPESDIQKLNRLQLKPSSFASLVRDLFIFSFYALGMPFVDLAFLRKNQIKDDKLTYYRHKTGQNITIKLEPCMKDILSRYLTDSSEYVFPIIKSSDNDKAYSEYQMMLNRYNKKMKILARKAGIQSRLTSYTPRHTWASLAYSNCIDLHVISKGLGHSNPQTTLTYIRQIDDNRLEEANHTIVSKVASCII